MLMRQHLRMVERKQPVAPKNTINIHFFT
jgi:hypothetical protein